MENNNINRLLLDYLSGMLTTDDISKLKNWIESSSENRRIFNQIVNIWQGAHPVFNPEQIDADKAEKQLFAKIEKKTFSNWLMNFRLHAAAILIILLSIFSLYLIRNQNKDTIIFTDAEYQEITIPYGTYSEMNLPDGSKVWLNGGSSLKYPVRFTSANREVQLRGEGFFEVKSDKTCPFIVKTGNMTLKATGTAFNIEAYDTDSMTAVTMVDGLVDITFAGKTSVSMSAAERITYNSLTAESKIQQFDSSNHEFYKWYSWKDGLMVLRNDPMSFILKRLTQIYHVEFIVCEPEIANAKYRATFHKESLGEILRLLEMTAPIQFKYKKTQLNNIPEKQQIEVCWKK